MEREADLNPEMENFSKRKDTDDTDPEDLGLCSKSRTIMDAAGFCSKADEVEET